MLAGKVRLAIVGIFTLVLCFGLIGQAGAQPQMGQKVRLIVGFNRPLNQDEDKELGKQLKGENGETERTFNLISAKVVTVDRKSIDKVKSMRNVAWVEEDVRMQLISPPEPSTQQIGTWGPDRIDAEVAHAKGYTGAGVKVAIIDTGIDYTHPDLAVAGGQSFVSYTTSYKDDAGHGTHVAGIVAARNNTMGIEGVAPDVKLYAVKVLDQDGNGYWSDTIAGIATGRWLTACR